MAKELLEYILLVFTIMLVVFALFLVAQAVTQPDSNGCEEIEERVSKLDELEANG